MWYWFFLWIHFQATLMTYAIKSFLQSASTCRLSGDMPYACEKKKDENCHWVISATCFDARWMITHPINSATIRRMSRFNWIGQSNESEKLLLAIGVVYEACLFSFTTDSLSESINPPRARSSRPVMWSGLYGTTVNWLTLLRNPCQKTGEANKS